jgi:adenylylsulfate kinase-like enzyme
MVRGLPKVRSMRLNMTSPTRNTARAGELVNFTGISSPFEEPEHPDIQVDTCVEPLEQSAGRIVDSLQ